MTPSHTFTPSASHSKRATNGRPYTPLYCTYFVGAVIGRPISFTYTNGFATYPAFFVGAVIGRPISFTYTNGSDTYPTFFVGAVIRHPYKAPLEGSCRQRRPRGGSVYYFFYPLLSVICNAGHRCTVSILSHNPHLIQNGRPLVAPTHHHTALTS